MKSRTTRTIAMTVAAGLTAALIPAAVALHDTIAIADPAPAPTTSSTAPTTTSSHTSTTAPSQAPTSQAPTSQAPKTPSHRAQGQIGTANLLQYNDLANNTGLGKTVLTHAVVGEDTNDALSACTGEQTIADVVGIDTDRFHARWTSDIDGASVHEVVADNGDEAYAVKSYQRLLAGQQSCQDEPAGHWRYGKAHTVREGTGVATWFAATDGDGTRDGGVIVARNGLHLAVVEVNGEKTTDAGMAQLARSTVDRLA